MVSAFFLSCSSEEAENQTVNDRALLSKKLSYEVYPEFDSVMDDLYSKDYNIADVKSFKDGNDRYLVSEVYLGADGDQDVAGYFVTDSGNRTVYLEYQKANDILNQYEFDSNNNLVIEHFDLTLDPNYPKYPFGPGSPLATNGKFFGWGGYERGPCEEINGEWSKPVFQRYYSFGVAVKTKTTMELDGITPLREPCGPSVDVE